MKKIFLLIAIFLVAASCNLNIFGSGVAGVLKTLDGGQSWKASDNLAGASGDISSLSISEIQFDPSNHQTMYLSAVNRGLFRSDDNAGSWKQILSKISVYDFFVDPSNDKNIYTAGIYGNHGKIISSNDGGITWNEIYNEATATTAINSITGNYNNPKELYAGLSSGILIKSTDAGSNWSVENDFQDSILKVRYNPLNKALYILLRTKGIAKSIDGGKTWNFLTTKLTNTLTFDEVSFTTPDVNQFVKMALDPQVAGVIYTTTSNGLYKTVDDGNTWNLMRVPINTINNNDNINNLPRAIASANGGMLAYTSIDGTLFKSINGGQSWQTQELPTTNPSSTILIDPSRNDTVYIGLITP